MLPAISSATSGIRAASLRLAASGRMIANPSTGGSGRALTAAQVAPASVTSAARQASPVWTVATQGADPTKAMLEQAAARIDFVANTKMLAAAQGMVKRLFEMAD